MKYWAFQLVLLVVVVFRLYTHCNGHVLCCENTELSGYSGALFSNLRQKAGQRVRELLPSPHSELLLGMVMGVDAFDKLPKFTQMLRTTGTIHVVVVSGYNISLVFTFVQKLVGSVYKVRNLIMAQVVVVLYALLSGFEPPVIRACVMGSVAAWGKFYGRRVEAERLLVFSALVMLVINPAFLFSLSFQLSFLATLSLVVFTPYLEHALKHVVFVFREDFVSTVAAQVLVWPLLSYKFGSVSLVGIVVNTVCLWTVPLITTLGFVFVLGSFVPGISGVLPIVSWLVYVPLDIFTRGVEFFSRFTFLAPGFELGLNWMWFYYVWAFLMVVYLRKHLTP